MRFADIFRLRLRSLLNRRGVERELDDELRYHFDRQVEQGIESGLTPEDARRAASRTFAGVAQRKEECRDSRGVSLLDNAYQDLRYTLRQLRKTPGFTCSATLVLTLGICAVVAIFGFVDAALIKPLPYKDQSRLVAVYESSNNYPRSITSYLDFVDWRRLNSVFSSIDAYALNGSFTLTNASGAEQVPGTRVSAGFFQTLGVKTILGRDFLTHEEPDASSRSVILSYSAWQKRFGGQNDVLGRTITLNGKPTTIVGVLPPNFHFAPYSGADFWGNLRSVDSCEQVRDCRNLGTVARLKESVSIDQAAAQMRSIVRRLQKQYPTADSDVEGATLIGLRDLIVGDVRPILLALLTGAALLLLIACVNVSTLLLSRSDQRRREFAVRGALGASFSRLIGQFAIEGFVLTSLGCALGLLSAHWGMHLLTTLVPPDTLETMPYLIGLGITPRIAVFGCCIALLANGLFAVIPISRMFVSDTIEGLKEGNRGSSATTWRRLGSNLVVIEVAVSMVLMAGAGLLGKSLYRLLHTDTGLVADGLLQFGTSWSPGKYKTDREVIALGHNIVDHVSAIPGITSVALTTAAPIDSDWMTGSFHITGSPNRGETNEVFQRQVSAAYFSTLRARLLRGRYFREQEDNSKPLVAVVNRTLANTYFSAQNPLGKQIYYDWQPNAPMEIVGVVDDIREGPLTGASRAAIYVPFNQTPVVWPVVLVRVSKHAPPLQAIATAIKRIDPFITVSEGQSIAARIDQSPAASLHRSAAFVTGLFGATALLLSTFGLYGVVAYSVTRRRREIGVRMALGAERLAVYRLVLRESGRLVLSGVLIGAVCSVAAATLMRALLFGVRPWDASTLVAVMLLLGASALLASFIPARRAASLHPLDALRSE